MYLCMPIARANPNLIQSYLLELQKDPTVRARDLSREVILYRLPGGSSSSSIYPSCELIDLEKFTNFVIIIVDNNHNHVRRKRRPRTTYT